MVTMKDIAKMAGVSQATVSRVINGNPAVGQEERQRVMECVRKSGYKPNIMAKSLNGSKTNLIGVIVPQLANPFFAEVVNALEKAANTYGYSVILCNTEYSSDKERKYVDILKSYRVDGIVIVPSNSREEAFKKLKNSNIPIVAITQNVEGFTSISISHRDSGKEVAKHFIDSGCSRFIFVGQLSSIEEKEQGFKEYIIRAGFDVEKAYLNISDQYFDTMVLEFTKLVERGFFKSATGIFAKNDLLALNVMHILKDKGVRIPEEVLLVGFDNAFFSKDLNPTLSTVAQPNDMMGIYAIENLVDKICGRQTEEKHIVLGQRLIVRESSMKQIIL